MVMMISMLSSVVILLLVFILAITWMISFDDSLRSSSGSGSNNNSSSSVVLKKHYIQDDKQKTKIDFPPLPPFSDKRLPDENESKNVVMKTLRFSSDQKHRMNPSLVDLKDDFESWILHHNKAYKSPQEKERRFRIWSENHQKTIEKNRRHGPCKVTKQSVFGSNFMQDLTEKEFNEMYLAGYKGPKEDNVEIHRSLKWRRGDVEEMVLNPSDEVQMHENVRQNINIHQATTKGKRLLQKKEWKLQPQQQTNNMETSSEAGRSYYCSWYDILCWLRWLWQSTGVQFGDVIEMTDPMFGYSFSYPDAIDWRDFGAVTRVRSQSGCGGCWAMTAVETIESAHYIATGNLYGLSEAEVITCDDSCKMCNGGWPQNAFAWAMEYDGLLESGMFPYDATTLLAISNGDDSWTEDIIKEYKREVCPGDHDSKEDGQAEENQDRFGNIKGYGYSTSRCICYSDGTGCDCQNQSEEWAVANVASRGPAVVCLDASMWKDYNGGIITKESGCTSSFYDMNHCVQVVGYVYLDDYYEEDESYIDEDDDDGSGSNSRSRSSSDTQDDSSIKGYWIIRNEWSTYWGMDGYAYVAMGENTCGILNSMMHAVTK